MHRRIRVRGDGGKLTCNLFGLKTVQRLIIVVVTAESKCEALAMSVNVLVVLLGTVS